jgi:hypothetical protein
MWCRKKKKRASLPKEESMSSTISPATLARNPLILDKSLTEKETRQDSTEDLQEPLLVSQKPTKIIDVEVYNFKVEECQLGLNSQAGIVATSIEYGEKLSRIRKMGGEYQPDAFLVALSGIESSFGLNDIPRYEPAYGYGGRYAKASHLAKALERYGALAACSYGPWQVMYIVAYELGFRDHPLRLWHRRLNCQFAVEKINQLIDRGAKTVSQILDGYNSGNFTDQNVPSHYLEQFPNKYNYAKQLLEEYKRRS